MGGSPVTPRLERLIAETPTGSVLKLEDVQSALKLERSQVQSAMLRLTKDVEPTVEVISRGYSWRVRRGAAPGGTPTGPVFTVAEDLGTAKLLRDGDGTLWLAKRVGVAE